MSGWNLGLPAGPLERALARHESPAFAEAMQDLRDEAAAALESPLRPVARNGGYYHSYFCPDDAAELIFDEHTPTQHKCPVCGRVWTGQPFDDSWLWTANRRMAQRAYRLALLWRLEGKREHLDAARQILTEYAAIYPDVHSPRNDPSVGKITYSALDESVWAIPIAWACHWIWPGVVDDRDLLRTRLLEPAAAHIESQRTPRIHNYENWLNAALTTLGTALGDEALVRTVIDDTYGLTDQLARGVLDDGHWYEGASSYHYYTLGAVLYLAQAREGLPGDPVGNPTMRRMFEAPLRIAYPDDFVPAINDCWYHSRVTDEVGHGIPNGPGFYEIAAGTYGAPEFEAVLTRAYRSMPRSNVESLLYGPDDVSDEAAPPLVESNESASGFAVLRPQLPLGSQGELLLKYGPHGGGHGHADKLALSIYGGGRRWGADLGTPGYGIAINDSWYRHTLSHSTILLEGEAQPPATGEALRYRPVGDNDFGIADAQVHWEQGPYAAVYARRVVLSRHGYFIVLTRVEAPVARRAHVVFHHEGEILAWPDGDGEPASLPENESYAHLSEARVWPAGQGAVVRLDVPVAGQAPDVMTVAFAPLSGASLLTARSPGNPASDLRSTLITEVAAEAFWSAAAFVYGVEAAVEWHSAPSDGPPGLVVRCNGRDDSWSFTRDGDGSYSYPLDG